MFLALGFIAPLQGLEVGQKKKMCGNHILYCMFMRMPGKIADLREEQYLEHKIGLHVYVIYWDGRSERVEGFSLENLIHT